MQFPAPDQELRFANRELGTIEKIDDAGSIAVTLHSGRAAQFNISITPACVQRCISGVGARASTAQGLVIA